MNGIVAWSLQALPNDRLRGAVVFSISKGHRQIISHDPVAALTESARSDPRGAARKYIEANTMAVGSFQRRCTVGPWRFGHRNDPLRLRCVTVDQTSIPGRAAGCGVEHIHQGGALHGSWVSYAWHCGTMLVSLWRSPCFPGAGPVTLYGDIRRCNWQSCLSNKVGGGSSRSCVLFMKSSWLI